MTRALAPPPPLQTPATPILASLTLKTELNVVTILAPELLSDRTTRQTTIQEDVPMPQRRRKR